MNPEELRDIAGTYQFGDFALTNAIRVARPPHGIIPTNGYNLSAYRNLPEVAAAVSREKIFDALQEMLGSIAEDHESVTVVLESSHGRIEHGLPHQDFFIDGVDMWKVRKVLADHEDLVINDGLTGVAVIAENDHRELQLTEHKLLIAYARRTKAFRERLAALGIPFDPAMHFVHHGAHFHMTDDAYPEQFRHMAAEFGLNLTYGNDNDERLGV